MTGISSNNHFRTESPSPLSARAAVELDWRVTFKTFPLNTGSENIDCVIVQQYKPVQPTHSKLIYMIYMHNDTYHIHASIVFVEMQTTSSLVQGCESATKPIPGIMITSPHTCLHLELFPNFPHKITTNLRMYIDVTLVRIAQLTLGHIVMQRFSWLI